MSHTTSNRHGAVEEVVIRREPTEGCEARAN
ncbi:hypothetical protein AAKU64_001378 [Undibacterium sp. GrIS 1.8]